MSRIVDSSDGDAERVLNLGKADSGKQISFQLAQDFYSEITGRSEEIEEDYDDPVIVNRSDIEQLNHCVHQILEQYQVASFSYNITVKYVKDSSERYSSIERFSTHAEMKGKAVENIAIVYRVLILLPKIDRPQEYKVTIALRSREAEVESIREGMVALKYGFPIQFFEKSTTISFKIEFIDISVARAIMSSLDSWKSGLEKNRVNKYLKMVRSKSSLFTYFSQYVFVLAGLYFSIKYSNQYFQFDSTDEFQQAALFVLSFGAFLLILNQIGGAIGRVAERNLDAIYETSYINLSKADINLVASSDKIKRNSFIKAVFSLILTIVVGVTSSLVANSLV